MARHVTIFIDDAVICPVLEGVLGSETIAYQPVSQMRSGETHLWVGAVDSRPRADLLPEANIFTAPLRLGALLDRVRALGQSEEQAPNAKVGPYVFDLRAQELRYGEKIIRLTEKEMHILKLLRATTGGIVTRAQMLADVWGYADGVETHTLETHIYRLRQKLEEDPSNPRILLSAEQGYKLA
ncbi:MAG: winged helix-turn-helix domain-containing protein [Alphaproteobacteria bacterium]